MIFSCYYLFFKADGMWILRRPHFTIYYMFVLIWQMPYANRDFPRQSLGARA